MLKKKKKMQTSHAKQAAHRAPEQLLNREFAFHSQAWISTFFPLYYNKWRWMVLCSATLSIATYIFSYSLTSISISMSSMKSGSGGQCLASSLAGGSVLGSACGSGSSSQPGSRGCSRCLWVQEKEDEMFTLIIEKNYFVWDMTFIFCFSPYQVLEIVV